MVALSKSGQFNGYLAPKKMPGKYFHPPHLMPIDNTSTVSTTAARYYIVPFIVEQPTTFAGAWCWNSGTGDNGDKVKMAAYSEASGGGPGALAKSFGEVTLTGASAVRVFSSSWSASPGVYYVELVTDNAVTMYCMASMSQASNAGYLLPNISANTMGTLGGPLNSSTRYQLSVGADYVAGTYANFPEATSLTPTASLADIVAIPFFGLYT